MCAWFVHKNYTTTFAQICVPSARRILTMVCIHLSNCVIRTYGLEGMRDNWKIVYIEQAWRMIHFCAVLGCSNRSDRDSQVSYHCLPLRNKPLLKQWIHKIGRRNLLLNESTCVCSDHFVKSWGRMLRLDEVPSLKLPVLPTQFVPSQPRKQILRSTLPEPSADKELSVSNVSYDDAATKTDLTGTDLELLEGQVCQLKENVVQFEHECEDLKAKQPYSAQKHWHWWHQSKDLHWLFVNGSTDGVIQLFGAICQHPELLD